MSHATYSQNSGVLYVITDIGDFRFFGWAGHGPHRNNPKSQEIRGKGPLPVGFYRVAEAAHRRFHAPAFQLAPYSTNEMFGRSAFWIHGGTKSDGCIMLQRTARTMLKLLGVRTLEVVPDIQPKART